MDTVQWTMSSYTTKIEGACPYETKVQFQIPLKQPTRCNSFTSLLLDVYVWLNMFRAPPRSELTTALTLRLLMSYIYIYIYMERLFFMFLDHTQRRSTVDRTPLDE